MQGWVKLQRSILQQAVWAEPPEYYKIYNYLVVSVDRISGEFYTTYQMIADACLVKNLVLIISFAERRKLDWKGCLRVKKKPAKVQGGVISIILVYGYV